MSGQQSKADLIAERQANLPLPEDPPAKSDFNSQSTEINTKPGEEVPKPSNSATAEGTTTGLAGSATKGSGVREQDGAEMKGVGRK